LSNLLHFVISGKPSSHILASKHFWQISINFGGIEKLGALTRTRIQLFPKFRSLLPLRLCSLNDPLPSHVHIIPVPSSFPSLTQSRKCKNPNNSNKPDSPPTLHTSPLPLHCSPYYPHNTPAADTVAAGNTCPAAAGSRTLVVEDTLAVGILAADSRFAGSMVAAVGFVRRSSLDPEVGSLAVDMVRHLDECAEGRRVVGRSPACMLSMMEEEEPGRRERTYLFDIVGVVLI